MSAKRPCTSQPSFAPDRWDETRGIDGEDQIKEMDHINGKYLLFNKNRLPRKTHFSGIRAMSRKNAVFREKMICGKDKMLSLPNEVLDMILAFLSPPVAAMNQAPFEIPFTTARLPHPERKPRNWKQDCKNIRLTCIHFSQLLAPKEALFHDIYLYPWMPSLQKLSELSLNKTLAPFVRRIIFMYPQFSSRHLSSAEFRGDLENQLIRKYYEDLKHCKNLTPEEIGGQVEKLVKSKFAHSTRWLEDAKRSYLQKYVQQQLLLSAENGTYVECAGNSLSRLKNVSSIIISAGDGASIDNPFWYEDYKGSFPTWIQKFCPDVELNSTVGYETWEEQNEFQRRVFFAVELSSIIPTELSFIYGAALNPSFSFSHGPLWRSLRHLDISLARANDKNWRPDRWKKALLPFLLDASSTLQAIAIRGLPEDDGCEPRQHIDELLRHHFPALKNLQLENFRISGSALVSFLWRHRHRLQDLTARNIQASGIERAFVHHWVKQNGKDISPIRCIFD